MTQRRLTYADYRGFGHGALGSYMLSSEYQPFILAVIVGIAIGVLL